jgi:hypothetical protein
MFIYMMFTNILIGENARQEKNVLHYSPLDFQFLSDIRVIGSPRGGLFFSGF